MPLRPRPSAPGSPPPVGRPAETWLRSLLTSTGFHAAVLVGTAAWAVPGALELSLRAAESRSDVARVHVPVAVAEPSFSPPIEEQLSLAEPEVPAAEPDLVTPAPVEPIFEPEPLRDWPLPRVESQWVELDWTPPRETPPDPVLEEIDPAPAELPAEPEPPSEPAEPRTAEPVLLEGPAPAYPRLSIRLGEEGTVTCRIHVAPDGSVLSVEVVESSGSERLDEAARIGLGQWRFRPATLPQDSFLHTVVFELGAD